MKKKIIPLILAFSILFLNAQSCGELRKELALSEDENVKITLIHAMKADIGDSDWLNIKITNKTENDIWIADANYSINREGELENGKKYFKTGVFGQGNKYDLIHYYYDMYNSDDYRKKVMIQPKESIHAWKYLTNYASVLIEGRNYKEEEICAFFRLNVGYELLNEAYELTCDNEPFCFNWVNLENVSQRKLQYRLKEIILNPHIRWVNNYVTKVLMNREEVVSAISTHDLVKGVLLRENAGNSEENILFLTELFNRGAIPNEEITENFRQRLRGKHRPISSELLYYWDNSLLEDLLKSNKSKSVIHQILEVNAKYWSIDVENRKKVYSYLIRVLKFESTTNLDSIELMNWSVNVKMLATSRSVEVITYLKSFLDDETKFQIEDWSKYIGYGALPKGAKPDLITVRVCDVAFVALLRALNQFEFELRNMYGKTNPFLIFKDGIISKELVNRLKVSWMSNGIKLEKFEKEIVLTEEYKKKLRGR